MASRQPPQLPSDRSFGWTFTVVFGLVAAWLWWKQIPGAAVVTGLGVATATVTLAQPSWLRPFNRAWMAFGLLLHRIVSPVVLGFIYFVVITPIGLIRRAQGYDPMRRRAPAVTGSYWIRRDPPGPPPDSLSNQF